MKSVFIKRVLWVLLLMPLLLQAREFKAGTDYTQLATPVATQNPDKIEVQEFFWYGCPHCYQFEPKINAWVKNKPASVEFVRTPAPLNPNWMVHTKTYYALETMGKGEQYHSDIFSALHVEKMKLYTPEAMADFLEKKGLDRAKFLETFASFAVEMRASKAAQIGKQYRVSGVPALTVNGKYLVSTNKPGGFDEALAVVNYLVEKEKLGK